MSNISKDKFIEKTIFTVPGKTNKGVAAELGISESYFYKLLKKYRVDIDKALMDKKNSLRLKSMQVIEHHLNELNLKAALQVLRQIGWHEPYAGEIQTVDFEFKLIADAIRKMDTGS